MNDNKIPTAQKILVGLLGVVVLGIVLAVFSTVGLIADVLDPYIFSWKGVCIGGSLLAFIILIVANARQQGGK